MAILNPPGWIQALSTHSAAQLRSYIASLQAGGFPDNNSLRARGGVHPIFGDSFSVSQAGSPNMTVVVQSGACSIPGTENSTQGNYFAVNDSAVTLSISASHASLARIDIVVVNVRDAQYSGANNDVQLQVVTGTPASSPVAPTAPANSVVLAHVAVGAGVTSIVNANITDKRFYMAALGGVIIASATNFRPGGGEIGNGQLVYTLADNRLWMFNGTDYTAITLEDKGVSGFAVTSGTDTRNSTSYGNMAGTGSQTSFSFAKSTGGSRIRVDVSATFFTSATDTGASFGVNINGTDYEICRLAPAIASLNHLTCAGFAYISGVAAGTYTIQGRWKTIGGSGTITRDDKDWLAICARETNT